jgi:amino acid transporter
VSFKRALGPFDATMIVIGGIIGSGIFINPYLVARQLDSTVLVLLAWAAGGAIALAGAFAYAELGQRLPRAGGQYVYLGEAWHPLVGFLYGWALLFMIQTGAMAAVAITFAQYASRMVGGQGAHPQLIAIAAAVQLRSNPPQKGEDGTSYYELMVRRGGDVTLSRYQKKSGQIRQIVPANVTREVLQRLAEDFVAAVE